MNNSSSGFDFDSDNSELNVSIARIDERLKILERSHVSLSDFEPVKKLVFGMVACILLCVLASVLAIVITKR